MRTMAQAFNEWQRRYIETPEQFEREFQTIERFQAEAREGAQPSYGETCAAYLGKLMQEPSG